MRVDQIDQVTINVKNLEESVKLFSETLGITFFPPREVTVGSIDGEEKLMPVANATGHLRSFGRA